ncbi:protein-disulfide reductase DsbD domain-containing protein [Tropicimonas isoalkanivorans]|uniref:Disulphide bond corrector protein DsbC n=1 Tax=Tropicimonas isoalkanivorans TaxID=441112 RepID=A0A1I1N5J6_9RHOB|nr:protein-disulfide reductase DsbD domain-containing protein [Tropicimonas isoalkanivorans]SFC92889.1 Disulphide bond corrector protein DsbC [Tropicimonas isoalkanivorans]
MTRTRSLSAPAALFVALVAMLVPDAVRAGSGPPSSVVTGEVLEGWTTESGNRMAALRLQLAPGWKTYWRAPGDTGVPPNFSWKGSQNLRGVIYHWPSPDIFSVNGLRTVGYKHELVLPIELVPQTPGAPIHLRGAMDLGVCETVCMPANLTFRADMTGSGQSDPRIHQALASRPLPSGRAGVSDVDCAVEPISDGVQLQATITMPGLGGEEIALVETNDPRIWVSEPVTQRSGRTLRVMADLVPPSGKPLAVDRGGLRFTVVGASQAVDIQGCSVN